jgi:hypothetical protein
MSILARVAVGMQAATLVRRDAAPRHGSSRDVHGSSQQH